MNKEKRNRARIVSSNEKPDPFVRSHPGFTYTFGLISMVHHPVPENFLSFAQDSVFRLGSGFVPNADE